MSRSLTANDERDSLRNLRSRKITLGVVVVLLATMCSTMVGLTGNTEQVDVLSLCIMMFLIVVLALSVGSLYWDVRYAKYRHQRMFALKLSDIPEFI